MKRLTLDFETRSRCNLKTAGAYKYSLDPSTQPTCLAFKVHGQAKVYFLNFDVVNRVWLNQSLELKDLWRSFLAQGFEFSAHNAFFERCIYTNILVKRYGWPPIPIRLWRCTAAKAAACAIPRNLEGAGYTMNLSVQKDKRGYNAVMATCKPTKQWNAWTKARAEIAAGKKVGPKKRDLAVKAEPPVFLEFDANPETWNTLYTYCKIDVLAEEKLDEVLPDLIPDEQEIWHLNQKLNWRGLRVDIPTIQKIVGIMALESQTKLKELDKLTMGLVTKPGARRSILEFLALDGIVLPDIKAKTVDDALKSDAVSGDMRRLLEIRKALSKTSTKKYQAFVNRAGQDNRIRDILLYHGASTGRDTGTGLQPHNFPRGAIRVDKARPYAAVENVAECDADMLRLLYGDSLGILFSSILRNMLIPSEGFELFVADFSKIEVAVLWWLADNWPGLDVLNSGKDPYIYQASANTGKSYEEIERAVNAGEDWALDARQLGKAQVLGAGFRMGWKRFRESAYDLYRLKLTNRQSVDAIKNYREANPPVVELWSAYEDAAIEAVETGKRVQAGKCEFHSARGFLWVVLPSGRKLAYKSPSITWRVVTYTALEVGPDGEEVEIERTGNPKKTIQILGLDISKKNMRIEFLHGGIWAENITQAVARDVMMNAAVRLEKADYRLLLCVHDEALTEKENGKGSVWEFESIMCERPKWADRHLPIQAKAYSAMRYRK